MKIATDWLEFCASEMIRAGLFFGHGTDNAHDEAAWMLLHVMRAPLDGSFAQWDRLISITEQNELEHLLARRIDERYPLAYLTGKARFCDLDFIVTPDVLIPRSPMAELIPEQFSPWLDIYEGGRVLDMCTGGGCIAIAMAVHMPAVSVDAVDISCTALKIAARNVALHAVVEQVRLVQSDLFSELGEVKYDLIVSNPPYVDKDDMAGLSDEFRHEPKLGLASGDDGLDSVTAILHDASRFLNDDGVLVVEVGNSQVALMEKYPAVDFVWLEFEYGGGGVFLLTREQLVLHQDQFS